MAGRPDVVDAIRAAPVQGRPQPRASALKQPGKLRQCRAGYRRRPGNAARWPAAGPCRRRGNVITPEPAAFSAGADAGHAGRPRQPRITRERGRSTPPVERHDIGNSGKQGLGATSATGGLPRSL